MGYSNKKYLFYSGFTILMLFVFGFKDIWILACSKWSRLYAVVNTPRASWEEIYCYFPLFYAEQLKEQDIFISNFVSSVM